jgi:hypothetical protein
MKYAVEMGSDAMTCIESFIQIASNIQTFIRGKYRQHADIISLLFMKIRRAG